MSPIPLHSILPLLDSLAEVVWFRLASGEYVFVNAAFERVYGMSRSILSEDPDAWLERVAPEDHGKIRRLRRRVREEPIEVEWDLEHPAGSRRRLRSRVAPLHGADGSVIGIGGITEHRERRPPELDLVEEIGRARSRLEDAVHQSKIYRETLDRITDGFFALDRKQNFVYVNRRFEDLVGKPYAEVVGRGITELFPETEIAPFHQEYATALRENVTREFEAYYPPLSAWYHVRAYPSAAGLSVFFRDVTERRRMEEELVRIASEEQKRIGGELHDSVGQKLSGAAYMLQALESRLEKGEPIAPVDLRKIREVVLSAIATTRRISRGLFPAELSDQPLGRALEKLARDLEDMFGFECEVAAGSIGHLSEDRALHLFRIVQEVLTNAIKHGGASESTIGLSREGEDALVQVYHDGLSLPEDGGDQGLGLRLIAYRLNALGGSLEVSETGTGRTCITCRIPLSPPA